MPAYRPFVAFFAFFGFFRLCSIASPRSGVLFFGWSWRDGTETQFRGFASRFSPFSPIRAHTPFVVQNFDCLPIRDSIAAGCLPYDAEKHTPRLGHGRAFLRLFYFSRPTMASFLTCVCGCRHSLPAGTLQAIRLLGNFAGKTRNFVAANNGLQRLHGNIDEGSWRGK